MQSVMLPIFLVAAANGERPPLPFTPPFVTMEVEKIRDEWNKDFKQIWQNELEKSLVKGKISVKDFLQDNRYKDGQSIPNLGFKLLDLSEEGLQLLLKKEISYVNDPADSKVPFSMDALGNIGSGPRDAGILVQSLEGLDDYNRLTTYHYIYALFIKNLKF